jgi:hypothetical protein
MASSHHPSPAKQIMSARVRPLRVIHHTNIHKHKHKHKQKQKQKMKMKNENEK